VLIKPWTLCWISFYPNWHTPNSLQQWRVRKTSTFLTSPFVVRVPFYLKTLGLFLTLQWRWGKYHLLPKTKGFSAYSTLKHIHYRTVQCG
jgi:hypothetical protein